MKLKSAGSDDTVEEVSAPVDIKQKKKVKKSKKSKDVSEADETCNGHTNGVGEVDVPADDTTILPEGDFQRFRISAVTIKKMQAKKITYLFPIQAQTFDYIYDGKDVVAQARTGTGKTLSFALPIVEKLQGIETLKAEKLPKVLVLTPTRELAKQVCEDFQSISSKLSFCCVYGGTPYGPQLSAMRRGLDVLVGTPGRVLDHIQSGNLDLSKLKYVVLDEVDHMLDMGFAEAVGNILESAYIDESKKPQTLLFSATVPPWVEKTARKYMKDWKSVILVGKQEIQTSTTVTHHAIKCGYYNRAATIGDLLQVYSGSHGRAIIFCQTKKDADELVVHAAIKQDAHVLHGDIPQAKREMVLKGFKKGKYNVLVTTDVAARGLDIPEIDLVIQSCPPRDVDSYIHRAGRTGRAGRSGTCICFYMPREEANLRWVEKSAHITFKRISPPSIGEIIKLSATDAVRSLDKVPQETLQHFRDHAEQLLLEKNPVDVVCAALAIISGSSKVANRSLLSSQEDYTTYIFRTNQELRGMGYARNSLDRQIPDISQKVTGMKFCKDKMGCAFDLPSDLDDTIEQTWIDGKFDSLKKATVLPELLESGFGNSQNGRGFRGGGGFRGGNRNGRWNGGRSGGYSGGRGGGDSGGRGGGYGGGGGSNQTFKRRAIDQSPGQNKKIKFE